MHIVPSPKFGKEIKHLLKKYPSLPADFAGLLASLQTEPRQGTPLGRDCFKIRMAITSKGRGKSGGARVITCLKVVADTIYLLSIYDKSEKENLPDVELDAVLRELGLWDA